MNKASGLLSKVLLTLAALLLPARAVVAQEREAPGKAIGKISVLGNLILMELNRNALGEQNLSTSGSARCASRRERRAIVSKAFRFAGMQNSARN